MQDASDKVERMAEVFKAFGDTTRLQLIGLLTSRADESFCVIDLASKLGVSQPAVSQHLKVLKSIGLVKPNRKGFHVYYTIQIRVLEDIRNDFNTLYQLAFEKCTEEECEAED